jgi:hypothetical protein
MYDIDFLVLAIFLRWGRLMGRVRKRKTCFPSPTCLVTGLCRNENSLLLVDASLLRVLCPAHVRLWW